MVASTLHDMLKATYNERDKINDRVKVLSDLRKICELSEPYIYAHLKNLTKPELNSLLTIIYEDKELLTVMDNHEKFMSALYRFASENDIDTNIFQQDKEKGHDKERNSKKALFEKLEEDSPCETCDFALWNPVVSTEHTKVGLYNDSRYPGRTIMSFNKHYDTVEDMTDKDYASFAGEIKIVSEVIRKITQCDRVNIAILGNSVHHGHAHLIPRYGKNEEYPEKSPWNDPREKTPMNQADLDLVKSTLLCALLEA